MLRVCGGILVGKDPKVRTIASLSNAYKICVYSTVYSIYIWIHVFLVLGAEHLVNNFQL